MLRDDAGRTLPNYLKLGLYRDARLRDREVVFHRGMAVGTTRAAVDPRG
jgi:hypothetical protein